MAATSATTAKAVANGEGRLVFLSAADSDLEIGKTVALKDPKSGAAISSPSISVLAGLDSLYDVGSACRLPPVPGKAGEKNRFLFLAAPLAALAGWAIQQGVQWLVGEISSDLQEQVDKYTRSYEVDSASFDFYQSFTNKASFDSAKAYRGCVRLTSLASTPEDKTPDPVLSDLLIAVTHEAGQTSSVSLRSVRLFVSRVLVPTSDNQVAIAYSMAATSKARGVNNVVSEIDFSGPLLAAKLDTNSLTSQYFYKVYTGSEPGAGAHDFSIPSWDLSAVGSAPKYDDMKLSITVTEVGDVPWLLREGNNLVQGNKDSVSKYVVTNLQNAASAAINPTATPKKTSP